MSQSAWIYLVVSAEKQAETLKDQETWARRVALEHDWQIARQFKSVSSGAAGARRLLSELLETLRETPRAERPKRVLMTRLDRTGRGLALEPLAALAEIYNLGVIVHTREDGDVEIRRASDAIKPILRVLTGAIENEARRDKALATHAKKRELGLHSGHTPYGVTLVDGKPAAQEPQASIVRTMFAMRVRGDGLHLITKYAREHAPPKRHANGALRALRWNKATVRMMLHCRTYRGVVVDAATFDEVASISRPGMYPISSEGVWPLRGALQCSCGRMLSGRMSGRRSWRQRYYICVNHEGERHAPYFLAGAVEDAFVAFLASLKASPELDRVYRAPGTLADAARTTIAETEAQMRDIEHRRARVWEIYETGSVPEHHVRARLADHDESMRRLREQLDRAKEDLAQSAQIASIFRRASHIIDTLPRTWPAMKDEQRREVAILVARAVGGVRLRAGSTCRKIDLERASNIYQTGNIFLQKSALWSALAAMAI